MPPDYVRAQLWADAREDAMIAAYGRWSAWAQEYALKEIERRLTPNLIQRIIMRFIHRR